MSDAPEKEKQTVPGEPTNNDNPTTSPLTGEPGSTTGQDDNKGFDWQSFVANDPVLKEFKTPEELAKAYLELQKTVGQDKIPKPSRPEDLERVLKELGLPEDPLQYPDVEVGKELFESDEAWQEFKALAHEIGVLPNQFEKLVAKMKEVMDIDAQLQAQEREEMTMRLVQDLQREWGNEFEPKMKHIQRLFKTLPQELQNKIIESGLDLDINFIKFLEKVSQFVKEDSLTYAEYSVDDAKRELQAILNNQEHPYFKKEHPEHDTAVEKVQMLYKIIYG